MAILKIKNADGTWEEIPAIVGRKGDKGDSITIKSFTPSEADGGSNEIVFSDNTNVVVKNGKQGTKGADATINGVTALTIVAKDGIGVTQDGNVLTLHLTGESNETGSAAVLINRSTAVNEDDTNYSTVMARGSSLNATETTPTIAGAIYWTYG